MSKLNDFKIIVGVTVGVILILGLTVGWTLLQWYECREMDFSVIYCLKHIM